MHYDGTWHDLARAERVVLRAACVALRWLAHCTAPQTDDHRVPTRFTLANRALWTKS